MSKENGTKNGYKEARQRMLKEQAKLEETQRKKSLDSQKKKEVSFKEWLASPIPDLETIELFGDQVVVEVFHIMNKPSKIIGVAQNFGLTMTSIARVIGVSSDTAERFAIGDIISVNDDVIDTRINPEWEMYREAMKERPQPNLKNPPDMIIGNISLFNRYRFFTNKLHPELSTPFTYALPQSFIKTRLLKASYMSGDEDTVTMTSDVAFDYIVNTTK